MSCFRWTFFFFFFYQITTWWEHKVLLSIIPQHRLGKTLETVPWQQTRKNEAEKNVDKSSVTPKRDTINRSHQRILTNKKVFLLDKIHLLTYKAEWIFSTTLRRHKDTTVESPFNKRSVRGAGNPWGWHGASCFQVTALNQAPADASREL